MRPRFAVVLYLSGAVYGFNAASKMKHARDERCRGCGPTLMWELDLLFGHHMSQVFKVHTYLEPTQFTDILFLVAQGQARVR
jgi:hypothetical protein